MNISKTISVCIAAVVLLLLNTNTSQACTFKASFSGDTALCAGTSINYLSKLTSGHHYRWVVSNGTVVSGKGTDSIIVYWPSPGTGTVKLIDSTSACKDSLTKTIQIGLTTAVLSGALYNMEGGTTLSGKTYSLTQFGTAHEYSAVWNQNQINLNKNFDFTFVTNQSNSATPAEGMVFVLQNTGSNANPSSTQDDDMGYYEAGTGDMDQSVGIEEDIFQSS